MVAATGEMMAKAKGRPKKPGGDGSQVRVDADLASMARYVASRKGLKLIDYLGAILRPAIERDFRKAGKDLGAEE